MIQRLPIFFLMSALLPLSGQEKELTIPPGKESQLKEEAEEKDKKENEDARFRIPLGAVVSNVTLPYFSEDHRPISLLTAEEMRVEGTDRDLNPDADPTEIQRVSGKGLKLWLFDKEGLVKSIATIPEAKYHLKDEQVITSGPLVMRGANDRFAARSNGAIFTLKTGQALFIGPGSTHFSLPQKKKTTMIARPLVPMAVAVQILIAAPPELPPLHLENFEKSVARKPAPVSNADEKFKAADLKDAALAKRVAQYLLTVGKTELLSQVATPPVPEPDPFEEPYEFGPSDISIEFDNGAYFDSEALEVAYFGNIKIQGLGLKMTCNKDLKAIFNPPATKAGKKAKTKKDDSPLKSFGGFGDLKQVSANGRIRLEGTDKDGQKFFIRGDRALFESNPQNPKKEGVITLRGNDLSFIQGDPLDKKSEEPIIRGDATSKDAWAIVNIKQGLDPTDTDITVQFSKGNFKIGVISRKK